MLENKYNYNNQTGMYRHKVLLRQRSVAQDKYLNEIETYIDWGSYWAMVKSSVNNEVIEAGNEELRVLKRYVIKWSKKLANFLDTDHTSFELIHKGVTYDVKEAYNDNDLNRTITIYVEGRV